MTRKATLAEEARNEIRKLALRVDARCAHHGQPCSCPAEIQEDIAWWRQRLTDLDAS